MGNGPDVLVVGAGVSGLACARELARAGRRVRLLERARGVGGRCATRRLGGQPVDIGVAFLHGRDEGFLAALDEVAGTRRPGWPEAIVGSGRPCQPEAYHPGERRLAFAEGVSAFPRHLAAGLDVRCEARVESLDLRGALPGARLEGGGEAEAPAIVLAVAPEQAQRLLEGVASPPPAVASVGALLAMARSDASLSLAALYPPEAPAPPWHVSHPEASSVLQLVSHDSAKRVSPRHLALVYQAHPRWSREHLDDPTWPDRILEEAGRLLGDWARAPAIRHAHRWRYARTGRPDELAGPCLARLPGGGRLGICGDRFGRGGGVEAAWLSGRALAGRILAGEDG
jgi:predicted NAD/FAD-dependent oxidoreductase